MLLYSRGDFDIHRVISTMCTAKVSTHLPSATVLCQPAVGAFSIGSHTQCSRCIVPGPERFELVPFHNEKLMTNATADRELVPTLAIAKDSNQGTLFAQHSAITSV